MRFENFLADMGRRPSPAHSLDRIDNNAPYSPDNCRWATSSEQQRNKRTTQRYERGGLIGTPSEWARWLGISKELAHWRLSRWGTFEKGLTWRKLPKAV